MGLNKEYKRQVTGAATRMKKRLEGSEVCALSSSPDVPSLQCQNLVPLMQQIHSVSVSVRMANHINTLTMKLVSDSSQTWIKLSFNNYRINKSELVFCRVFCPYTNTNRSEREQNEWQLIHLIKRTEHKLGVATMKSFQLENIVPSGAIIV